MTLTMAAALWPIACAFAATAHAQSAAAQADMALAARVLHSLLQTGTANRAIELD
jgi:hypothetical protein